jgi:hypothetical protein
MAAQLKRAGSPLAHARVRKPPARLINETEGAQHLTVMEERGGTAEGAAGVQLHAEQLNAHNAARASRDAVKRDSRGALRRVAALGALLSLGLTGSQSCWTWCPPSREGAMRARRAWATSLGVWLRTTSGGWESTEMRC